LYFPSAAFSQVQASAGRTPQAQALAASGFLFSVAARSQVQSPAGRARHEQRAPSTAFSDAALSHVQCRADCLPHEHVACWAQRHSALLPQQVEALETGVAIAAVLGSLVMCWEGVVGRLFIDDKVGRAGGGSTKTWSREQGVVATLAGRAIPALAELQLDWQGGVVVVVMKWIGAGGAAGRVAAKAVERGCDARLRVWRWLVWCCKIWRDEVMFLDRR